MGVQFRKTKMVLNFLEDKPEVYKIAQVNFPIVSFQELIDECSTSCGVNTNQTKAVIDALVNRIVHYMQIGHGVRMGDFGTFKPAFRAKTAKNMEDATAKTVTRKVIRFYPGHDFRNMLNEMSVESASAALDDEE